METTAVHLNKYNTEKSNFVTPGKQLENVASAKPDEIALVSIDKEGNRQELTWKEFHKYTNMLAAALIERGVGEDSIVLVTYPNGIEHIIATYAIWKAGACYLPVPYKIASKELAAICKAVDFDAVFSNLHIEGKKICIKSDEIYDVMEGMPEETYKDVRAIPNMISLSGGTSGVLKFIRQNMPSGLSDYGLDAWFKMSGMDFDQVQLLTGPLFHGAPHTVAFNGLFAGHKLIISRNLSPEYLVELIKEYQVEFVQMVPTLMSRISKLPGISKDDFKSLKAFCHTGGACSADLKRKWLELVDPEKVYEIYSMTEVVGLTSIRGDEWLKHPGSVGRPSSGGKVSIRGEDGKELEPGEVGEIYMTPPKMGLDIEYVNKKQLEEEDGGFRSVGDMGYVDEDGYLYFYDRRGDMIVTGGENVFAAEVEEALLKHPDVDDAIVVGIPDEDLGHRLHAVVETKADLTESDLKEFLKEYLTPYKIPKTFETTTRSLTNENGKKIRKEILDDCIARGV